MITTSLEKHLGSVHAAQQAKQLRSVLIYTTTHSLFPTRGVTFQVQKLGTTKLQIIFTSNTFSLQKKAIICLQYLLRYTVWLITHVTSQLLKSIFKQNYISFERILYLLWFFLGLNYLFKYTVRPISHVTSQILKSILYQS